MARPAGRVQGRGRKAVNSAPLLSDAVFLLVHPSRDLARPVRVQVLPSRLLSALFVFLLRGTQPDPDLDSCLSLSLSLCHCHCHCRRLDTVCNVNPTELLSHGVSQQGTHR